MYSEISFRRVLRLGWRDSLIGYSPFPFLRSSTHIHAHIFQYNTMKHFLIVILWCHMPCIRKPLDNLRPIVGFISVIKRRLPHGKRERDDSRCGRLHVRMWTVIWESDFQLDNLCPQKSKYNSAIYSDFAGYQWAVGLCYQCRIDCDQDKHWTVFIWYGVYGVCPLAIAAYLLNRRNVNVRVESPPTGSCDASKYA